MEIADARALILEGVSLVAKLRAVRDLRHEGGAAEKVEAALKQWRDERSGWWLRVAAQADPVHPLAVLTERLGLTEPEIDLVLMALSSEVDPEASRVLAGPQLGPFTTGLNLELALSLLFHSAEERFAQRALLAPDSRLVSAGLITLMPIGGAYQANTHTIRPTETLLNFVLSRPLASGPLAQFCEVMPAQHTWDSVVLPKEDKQRVWELVSGSPQVRDALDEWGYGNILPRARGMVLLFSGPPGTGKSMFAHAVAHRLERPILSVSTSRLLASTEAIRPILAEAFNVAIVQRAVVVLDDCEMLLAQRDANFLALLECLDRHDGLLILTTNDAPKIDFAMERRIQYRLDFTAPDSLLREYIWELHLPPEAPVDESVDVASLATAYEFTGARIRNTVLVGLAMMKEQGASHLTMEMLRLAADTQLGARLDHLAVKTTSHFGMDRLILPEREKGQLAEVLKACKHREFVLSRWGFGGSLATGKGLCVLFDGPPGTGKTFAAEIMANELKLPLYRVHIPNVVSKWVGETERNIAEIFFRARAARAVLLFDEADSLFSRRTSRVESANDRYANMELNLLLQEIERYDGITFLTTNLYGNLDEALQRRILYRVTFPFPTGEERAKIWRVLMPKQAPLGDDVDMEEIGDRFELAGGHIKNALLRAAYKARDEGLVIGQDHLVDACLQECKAQGKIVREARTAEELEPPPLILDS